MKKYILLVLITLVLLGQCALIANADTKKETVMVTYVQNGRVYKQEEIEKGSKLVLEDPAPEPGYKFIGWDISNNVDLNNVTQDVTVTQKWERIESPTPLNPEKFKEAIEQEEQQIKDYEDALNKYSSVTKNIPKISYNKKKNILKVVTDVNATDVNIFYSTDKNFSKYKLVTGKVKKGKSNIKLKKLKKKKKYYVRVSCYVKYDYNGNEMIKTTRLSKSKKIIRKK